jgi:hypothetical protein
MPAIASSHYTRSERARATSSVSTCWAMAKEPAVIDVFVADIRGAPEPTRGLTGPSGGSARNFPTSRLSA